MSTSATRVDMAGTWGWLAVVTAEVVRDYAEKAGGVRPLLRQVTDRETGQRPSVVLRCGSTRESECPPCVQKARRLRMQQCAEGWHLAEDPLRARDAGGQESRS